MRRRRPQNVSLGKATSNDEGIGYEWSNDNLKEVELGILKRADTLAALAVQLGIDAQPFEESIARWNALCDSGRDLDFERPAGSLTPIKTPPFYGAPVRPTLSNTQGGPVHDAEQRIIDVYGKPIPRLYSAGELGSSDTCTYRVETSQNASLPGASPVATLRRIQRFSRGVQ